MNIVYIHGYASHFKRDNGKVEYLEQLGTVTGPNLDYTKPAEVVVREAIDFVIDAQTDLIVGTSLGGWMAAEVGYRTGTLFIAINPSIEPYKSLTFYDEIQKNIADAYTPMNLKGGGLIIVDKGDEVLNAEKTLEYVSGDKPTLVYEGGHHRFAHMEQALPFIQQFYNVSSHSFGFS